jgi:hypothetical protein
LVMVGPAERSAKRRIAKNRSSSRFFRDTQAWHRCLFCLHLSTTENRVNKMLLA